MAHFAEIGIDNIVKRVIVVSNNVLLDENNNEVEQKGIDFCEGLYGGNWLQTSYNGTIRKNFASKDYTYDSSRDAFIPPKPYASWVLNETTCKWESPTAPPSDWDINNGIEYQWHEANTSWRLIE